MSDYTTPLPVLMEDEILHTDERPFCTDRTCPCHTSGYPLAGSWRITDEADKIVFTCEELETLDREYAQEQAQQAPDYFTGWRLQSYD